MRHLSTQLMKLQLVIDNLQTYIKCTDLSTSVTQALIEAPSNNYDKAKKK